MNDLTPTRYRADFEILNSEVNGNPLVYLDNGATSLVPRQVTYAVSSFDLVSRSNVHRGVHTLSQTATTAYERARQCLSELFDTGSTDTVVYTSGTTASINLVAATWGRANINSGDTIVVSEMEHHSNIVPWQLLAAERGADIVIAPVNDDGTLDLSALSAVLAQQPKLLAVTHVSNVLGTVNPIAEIIEMAHAVGTLVMVDGAQAAPHLRVSVRELNADFYALSGHKMFGPTGTGILYGRADLLEAMPPWQGGGDMIRTVSFSGSTWAEPPCRFEAGTPNIAGFIGLAAAVDYMDKLDRDAVEAHEASLLAHASEELGKIEGVRIIGTAPDKVPVISFVLEGTSTQDIGTLLDMDGIAIRTGHHCAEPLMHRLGVDSTARASMAFYNTHQEVERFVQSLKRAKRLLT